MKTEISFDNINISLHSETLKLEVNYCGKQWKSVDGFIPKVVFEDKEIEFTAAKQITHKPWTTGVGKGIHSSYKGFEGTELEFDTVIWVESTTEHVHFELIPIVEPSEILKEIYWPSPLEFNNNSDKWYSVLNILQGLITPNTWKESLNKADAPLYFDGMFCSVSAYMPWWGQVSPEGGYMAISETPWDAAYELEHPANGPYLHVYPRAIESLGKLSYRRIFQYRFFKDCDYNSMCKEYRLYSKEKGLFTSLKEKAARCEYVDKLIGSAVVHLGIKTHISPESRYYDAEKPEKMDQVIPFSKRTAQMQRLKELGLEKVYLHLDGWGDPGYDNKHPDYLPACIEAGGWEGMKELSDTMKKLGYMFGIHDQYRDYYFDAPSFDDNFACLQADGKYNEHSIWAGGRQTYLCATQAPFYVKRNFEELFKQGIELEATYLDVFTCNEGDECTNPLHKMSRKECFEFRKQCFDYLLSRDILPSSEEVVDWSMQSLVFAHYAPYDHILHQGKPQKGIPTPLFNLVYHDCVISPWALYSGDGEFLYALLNSGPIYLNPDKEEEKLLIDIERNKVSSQLHEKTAKSEMVEHLFSCEFKEETAKYSCGTVVKINHEEKTYEINYPDKKTVKNSL